MPTPQLAAGDFFADDATSDMCGPALRNSKRALSKSLFVASSNNPPCTTPPPQSSDSCFPQGMPIAGPPSKLDAHNMPLPSLYQDLVELPQLGLLWSRAVGY